MEHVRLTESQKAALGYTDVYRIRALKDLYVATGTTDDDDYSVILDTVEKGDIIKNDTAWEIITKFSTDGTTGLPGDANTHLGLTIGTALAATSQVNGALVDTLCSGAATDILDGPTQVAAGTTYVAGEAVASIAVGTGERLVAKFLVADTDGNVTDFDYGEIWVWMNIIRLKDRGKGWS